MPFFGDVGSKNDIKILACSLLFNDVALHVEYIVNGNQYHLSHYLAYGIYLCWTTLVKTTSSLDNPKNMLFEKKCKKSICRMLKEHLECYRLVRLLFRAYHVCGARITSTSIMMTCIIFYNLIVEDECEYVEDEFDDVDTCPQRSRRVKTRQFELELSITYEYHKERQTLFDYMTRHNRVRSPHVHHDLINHI